MTTTDRLRALLDAATPGPWHVTSCRTGHEYLQDIQPEPEIESGYPLDQSDAALIVAAVNALPRLLAVVELAQEAHLTLRRGNIDLLCPICNALAALEAEP